MTFRVEVVASRTLEESMISGSEAHSKRSLAVMERKHTLTAFYAESLYQFQRRKIKKSLLRRRRRRRRKKGSRRFLFPIGNV